MEKTLPKALEKEADVVLQVKENPKGLRAGIEGWFHKCPRDV
ncbi:hypothetical protein [Alteromonas sp. 5E99-2]|nr:hypothetical protein [Alteromonas sp. 5E99-2]